MKNYNAFDLVVPAFLHTKKILGGKFDFKKWLYYAFVIFMSSSLFGFNCNFSDLIRDKYPNNPSCLPNESVIFLMIALIVVSFILAFVWMYLSCNFTYILNDSVLLNKTDIKGLWAKNNKKAKSYYGLIIKVIIFMILACILGGILIAMIGGGIAASTSNIGMGILGYMLGGCICFIIMLAFGIYIQLIANCAVPLHLRMDDNIPVAQVLKNLYNELKAKKELWKGFIALLAMFLINGALGFVYGIVAMGFVAVVLVVYGFMSESLVFWIIFAFLFLIYFIVIVFLNVPGVVFISSYRLLVVSFLSQENAVLLPLRDEKGKFIGTMSYFEHLEREREEAESTMMNDYDSYPQM